MVEQGAYMTADELRAALATLGWTQAEAARQLEVSSRLVRYWCAGHPDHMIPRVAELAIAYLLKLNTH